MRDSLRKVVGVCDIEAEGGSPIWVTVRLTSMNGDIQTARISVEDLFDIKYAAERVLNLLPYRSGRA